MNILLEGMATPGMGFCSISQHILDNPDQLVCEYNPEMARQLLADAAYEREEKSKLCLPPQ
jgi:hypothetical protein